MGKYGSLGKRFPAQSRRFNGEVYELWDEDGLYCGTTQKVHAKNVAKRLRERGNRARVIETLGKWWVYWR